MKCACHTALARAFSVHGQQCEQLNTHSFPCVSKSVEQRSKPKMSSGSWQGWQSWGASSRFWDEQQWEGTNWKNAEHEQKDPIRIGRSEDTLEVRVNGCAEPISRKARGMKRMNNDVTHLQSGWKASLRTRREANCRWAIGVRKDSWPLKSLC